MANWFNTLLNKGKFNVTKEGKDYYYEEYNSNTSFNRLITDNEKIKAIFSSPAAMFVFSLQCDLASLGKFKVMVNDEEVENDPIIDFLNKPNPLQTGKQFVWDYMFNSMLGNVNIFLNSSLIEGNKMYFLNNDYIEYPESFKKNKIILSDTYHNNVLNTTLRYTEVNNEFTFKYKQLIQLFDLTNGHNNFYNGISRLDSVYKIIMNSETALKSKNINTEFISKFFVAGKVDVSDTSQMPMGSHDKQSIRESMRSHENVYPTKTMIDVKRFVDNYGVLKALDESFLNDYYLIGKAFGIPRDVLEAYNSSTYENQEKARASHLSYTVEPKMLDLCNALETYFGYDKEGKQIVIDYNHLPHVQVFEKERAEARRLNAMAMKDLIDAGGNPEQVAQYLNIDIDMDGERNINRNEQANRETRAD